MEKINEKIENLLESEYYIIDIFPKRITKNIYFEIEEYFINHYLSEYAEKISKIIIILLSYYDFEYYVVELPEEVDDAYKQYKKYSGQYFSDISITEISDLIQTFIKSDISTLQIINVKEDFMISVNGNFSTVIFNLNKEQESFIKQIVLNEELYLRKHEAD